MSRPVVVTGTGAVSPYGYGSGELQRGWAAGKTRIEDGIARCDFAAEDHLSRREQRRYDRFAQLAIVAANEATEQAGWDGLPCDGARIGSIVGSGFGGVFAADAAHEALLTRGPQSINPASIPKIMSNAPAAALAMRYSLHGDVYQTGSACASSATAIARAACLPLGSGLVRWNASAVAP